MRPDEIADQIGLLLPEDKDYETLGGLIAARLGQMPKPGDRVELEVTDSEHRRRQVGLTVVAMDDLRVDRVRLESRPVPDPDPGESDERRDSQRNGQPGEAR